MPFGLPLLRQSEREPTVSIVLPVFNKLEYVERAVLSALSQDYPSLEVIAVDDGSTDGSFQKLLAIRTSHPSLQIVSQKNLGPSEARNSGLDIASGEFVMFHDADDVLEPGAIAHLVSLANRHQSEIAAGVSRRNENGRERIISKFRYDAPIIDFSTDQMSALRYCTHFSLCNKIFRRDFLTRHELRFTPGLYMQDIEFWLKCLMLTHAFSQTQRVISTYYFYPHSTSRSRTAARFASLERLFDNLDAFMQSRDLKHFRSVCNLALLQGTMMFFTRWKLKEWLAGEDLTGMPTVRRLLRRIPLGDLLRYFISLNRDSSALVFLLVRQGAFKTAYRADLTYQEFASIAGKIRRRIARLTASIGGVR